MKSVNKRYLKYEGEGAQILKNDSYENWRKLKKNKSKSVR